MTSLRPSSGLPSFIERGGEPIHRGPYQQDATDLRAFVIRADRSRLTALCERSFEAPSRGAVRCRPLSELIVLSFAQIGRLTCLDPEHRDRGWMTETDVVFWIPVLVEFMQDGAAQRSLAWAIPYIFVDQASAVITGREVYGFPKVQGRFEIPTRPDGAEPYRVFAPALASFTPTTKLVEQQILELRRRGPVSGDAAASIDPREALELILGDTAIETLAASLGGLPGLVRGEVPVLFLRQLRDIADPSRAAFQEILLAPAKTTALRSASRITGEFELEIVDTASHPIARDLGLSRVTPIQAAFHLDFDFSMERGRSLFVHAKGKVAGPSAPTPQRQRIAVLGGGLGSLAAVFEITEQPGWRERFEITVYQLGYRLGGKGASGRNRDAGQRIEEHGLHVWFGFYENAFSMMRRCYAAAQRAPGTPLSDWREAFEPHDHVVLEDLVDGAWSHWTMVYPKTPGEPGDGAPTGGAVAWVARLAATTVSLVELAFAVTRAQPEHRPRGTKALLEYAGVSALLAALKVVQTLGHAAAEQLDLAALLDQDLVTRARAQLFGLLEQALATNQSLRRVWVILDLQLSMLTGIARDRLLVRGFEAIDDLDFIAWLRGHGASEITTRSAPLRVMYDLAFAYEAGDITRPAIAAGVAVHGLLRMVFGYKGAVMWKMRAGMGDAVFAPLYEVLRARGVAFEFFHRVRALGLDQAGSEPRISSITVGRQATLVGGRSYEPLVTVEGLACWPDRPNYDQLVEAEALVTGEIDLESTWARWPDVETRVLREGQDFDAVILGIPPAALRSVARELVEQLPQWRTMIDEVTTVCTHAFELWTIPDLEGLGWRSGGDTTQGPVLGAYVEPTDTYADMSHLIAVEAWPPAHTPGHIAYFCGPLSEPELAPPDDHEFPRREHERVFAMAEHFLDHHIEHLWPRAVDLDGRFDRALLVDVRGATGRERLRGQFFRANVEPSDRYTQSLPGTIASRLRADGSGVANLFLAGDWIDNGLNAGCVEAAVMSGMLCARAVTGEPISIADEPERLRPAAADPEQSALGRRLLARMGLS